MSNHQNVVDLMNENAALSADLEKVQTELDEELRDNETLRKANHDLGDLVAQLRAQVETAKEHLTKYAVKRHVRLAEAGRTVTNGYSCDLCDAECPPDYLLRHNADCILCVSPALPSTDRKPGDAS